MSTDLVIGIDSSTTATKAIAWTNAGAVVAEGRSGIPLHSPAPNHYEQDAANWWSSCVAALRRVAAGIDTRRVAAVAVSNQRETFVPLDRSQQPLRRAIVWLDERCKAEVPWLAQQVGPERLHRLSGKPVGLSPVVYRIAWMRRHEPELVERTATFCDVHAYLVYRLSGERATSRASADPFGCFAMETGTWSGEILAPLEIDPARFPEAHAPGTVLGRLTAQAAAATGLQPGTAVIAGGGDGQCAGLGCAVLQADVAYLNLGTAVVSGVHSDTYRTDRAFRTMGSCAGSGYILESCLRSGTFLVGWLVEQLFGADPHGDIFEQLEREAAAVPVGSEGLLLVPYWLGVMNPYWEMDARGSMIGLSPAHTRAHLYRAVLEGIALEQAMVTAGIERVTGVPVTAYRSIGGGAASDLWCRIMADCAGRRIERLTTVEASNLGAAMAAAVGAGWFDDFAAAAAAMRGTVARSFTPDARNHERYARLMTIYRQIHPRLSDLYPPLQEAIHDRPDDDG